MKTKFFLLLFIFIGINASAEEKILECNGNWEDEGINLPKADTPFIEKKQDAYQQYLFKDDSITIVSGTPNIKDNKIELCKKTESSYIYAWDCSVTEPRRMAVDWTLGKEDNLAKDSAFHQKWLPSPNSYIGAKIIYLDRVNLSIIDDEYQLHTRSNYLKKSGKLEVKLQNYAIINHFRYQCKIAKSKL